MTTYALLAGLPGTGKSTLAEALSTQLRGSIILNKDTVRAALFPGEATDYSEAQDNLCIDSMLSAAGYLCGQPHPPRFIFFDGRTFSRAAHIQAIIEAAEAGKAAWRILHLWCADELALQRLAAGSAAHPAKNRDAALYATLKQHFEPIQQSHLSVDTGQPLEACVQGCIAYLNKVDA